MSEEKKESKHILMKSMVEHAMGGYEEEVGKLEEFFFELEKIKPIDFQEVYILLPLQSRRKKKTILWGFSLARRCNSKVYIVTKASKKILEELEKVSKAMDVEFEVLDVKINEILKKIECERNLLVLPKDMVKRIKGEEKHMGPVIMV